MKKFISIIALLLSLSLLFTACKDEEENNSESEYEQGKVYFDDPALDEEVLPGVLTSISDLSRFFVIESIDTMGIPFNMLFEMVNKDNCVVQPLIEGVDVSETPEYARIAVTPPSENLPYSQIVYYYTNGAYNTTIRVFYLSEAEFNVAMIDGYNALINGDPELVSKETYGTYTIVTNLPDETSYAETVLFDKYFVTITGAPISNSDYANVIDKSLLDILSFETVPLLDINSIQ